jgi:hypothetical protein
MCELYVLLAFGLGLLSGWFANFILLGRYASKSADEETKEEAATGADKEHKKFNFSTLFWVLAIISVVMFLIYMTTRPSTPSQASQEGTRAIENADSVKVFDNLVDSMKKFSR